MAFFPDVNIFSARSADIDQRFYDELPFKPEDILTGGGNFKTMCSHCHSVPQAGAKTFPQCSTCKSVWYCSKECQKKAWPSHKPFCKSEEIGFSKFVEHLLHNRLLQLYLQMALVHIFDLKSGRHSPEVPILGRITVGFEPTNILTLMAMRQGKFPPASTVIPGMFQLNRVVADWDMLPSVPRIVNWRKVRDQLIAKGFGDNHVLVLEFSKGGGPGISAFSVPFPITPTAMELAYEENVLRYESSITGMVEERPNTGLNCVESINYLIRRDTRDMFRMRTPMRDKDVELIEDAVYGRRSDTVEVIALKQKWEYEAIYTPAALIF